MTSQYEQEARSLVHRLKQNGFTILRGDNGEDKFEYGVNDFFTQLLACDEAWLTVLCPSDGKKRNLYLVLGNSPGELVADYNCDDGLDKVVSEHYNYWDKKVG